MMPITHSSANRKLTKPKDWNDNKYGECQTLSITDIEIENINFQISFWKPNEQELEMINSGKCIALGIAGKEYHPVVFISIES